jgi:hypothetical protein
LAALRTGLVTYRVGSETKRCAVGPGFAEAGPDKLVILTDEFTERAQIDPVVVRRDLAEVQQKLAKLEGVPLVAPESAGADRAAAEARGLREALVARENWLAAQLELYGDPPAATQRPYEEFGPPPPPPEDEVLGSPNGSWDAGAAVVAKPSEKK